MKFFCYLIAYCLSTCMAKGQINTTSNYMMPVEILKADSLIRGIYINFNEFQQNNPSVKSDFRSVELDHPLNSIYNNMRVDRLLILDNKNELISFDQPHWGICDGENIYKNYMGRYQKVTLDGKYSEFTGCSYNYFYNFYCYSYLLDVTNDNIIIPTLKNVKKLLFNENKEIYNEFLKDKDKNLMKYTYVQKLNQTYMNTLRE